MVFASLVGRFQTFKIAKCKLKINIELPDASMRSQQFLEISAPLLLLSVGMGPALIEYMLDNLEGIGVVPFLQHHLGPSGPDIVVIIDHPISNASALIHDLIQFHYIVLLLVDFGDLYYDV